MKSGAKKVASKALDATGPGIGAGTTGTGAGAIALARGAAAASATGIGIVVVGGLATLGAAAKSVVAAKSSRSHRDQLEKIYQRCREYNCFIPPDTEGDTDQMAHARIASDVLPSTRSLRRSSSRSDTPTPWRRRARIASS